jgi:hypothetical protein
MDLLFMIIEDEGRTRRAMRLLLPLAAAAVVIVAILATWAILQPARSHEIEVLLAGSFLVPIASGLKHAVRIRR